jgi:uncharacterized protein YjfI (DUF2170 family)
MRGKKAKQLRKTLLRKTEEVLLLVRNEYGDLTMQMTPQSLSKAFKRMYKKGLVPNKMLVK